MVREPFDIDVEFARCAKAMGAEILDELDPPPQHEVAECIFRDDKVIVELKQVQRDMIGDPRLRRRLEDLHQRMQGHPDMPIVFGGPIRVPLPQQFGWEYSDFLKQCLQPAMKKANKQIKETRENLGPPDALGLLMLCIDEGVGLNLHTLVHVISRIESGGQMSGINNVIIFSETCYVAEAGGQQFKPWLPTYRTDRPRIESGFLDRLREAWMKHTSDLTGQPLYVTPEMPAVPFLNVRLKATDEARSET